MQLTSHTDYALRLLIYLMVHQPRSVSTREVAAAYGISLNHLTKVAKSLTKAGWIITARGGGGGLMLAPHTPDATVGAIVRHTEATCELVECFNGATNMCVITQACQLKPLLFRARKAFFDVLDGATIRDISGNPETLGFASKRLAPAPDRVDSVSAS